MSEPPDLASFPHPLLHPLIYGANAPIVLNYEAASRPCGLRESTLLRPAAPHNRQIGTTKLAGPSHSVRTQLSGNTAINLAAFGILSWILNRILIHTRRGTIAPSHNRDDQAASLVERRGYNCQLIARSLFCVKNSRETILLLL